MTGSKWLAVLITAIIFSFLHFELTGFLPRLFAGMVIGAVFLFSRSIVIAIISHFVYNGSLVLLRYIEQHSAFDMNLFLQQLLNPYLIIAVTGLMVVLFFRLRKTASWLAYAKQ